MGGKYYKQWMDIINVRAVWPIILQSLKWQFSIKHGLCYEHDAVNLWPVLLDSMRYGASVLTIWLSIRHLLTLFILFNFKIYPITVIYTSRQSIFQHMNSLKFSTQCLLSIPFSSGFGLRNTISNSVSDRAETTHDGMRMFDENSYVKITSSTPRPNDKNVSSKH